jgi:aminopeptidase
LDEAVLNHYAQLVVDVGVNVQPDMEVAISAPLGAATLVRALATKAYEAGARFVDPWYFDPIVKRIRAERASEESLDYVPGWYGSRVRELGAARGARISIVPSSPPGLMAGIDPRLAGRDLLPAVPESLQVINDRAITWCVVPWTSHEWARVVYPELGDKQALTALVEDLTYVLRLDEPDAIVSWRERFVELKSIGDRLTEARLDAIRFLGPGTDLTIGLLPTARFVPLAAWSTADGVPFAANLPSEEILTTPDPRRADGFVTSTKPLALSGTVIEGLRLRFERGQISKLEAETGVDALRVCVGRDEGAARLGEVALVDRDGRVGKTGRLFFNTLLDENAASHLALGNAYAIAVGEEDLPRINRSAVHIDFMIGSDEIEVTGLTGGGDEIPVLRSGAWQL